MERSAAVDAEDAIARALVPAAREVSNGLPLPPERALSTSPPPVPFTLEYAERTGYLFVRVTGINGSLETTVAYWLAIAAEGRARRPSRLLVKDDMLGEPPSPAEIAQFIGAMAGQGFEGVRVAYVEADGEQVAQVEHGEIYAREQGFDGRVFGSEQQAELWLRYGNEP
jgi:hypothetical protein